jgi:hypothetical protein
MSELDKLARLIRQLILGFVLLCLLAALGGMLRQQEREDQATTPSVNAILHPAQQDTAHLQAVHAAGGAAMKKPIATAPKDGAGAR